MKQKTCWVASDGKIGIDNQCIGLAEALGLQPEVKHAELRAPWKQLFPFVPLPLANAFTPAGVLSGPWPDLLITGGRTGAAISLFIKKASGGKTVTVQVQNPHVSPAKFDVMVVGEHDGIAEGGPGTKNVVAIKGALNRVTPQKIADGMAKFPQLATLPSPRVAVLLGGTNRCYSFEKLDAETLAAQLSALAASGYSVMVTASRRTGAENEAILRAALTGPNTYFWDNTGENPFFAMLGYADAILPTVDSISMVSEAATTGKPVLVIPLSGGDSKFRAFHKLIQDAGVTRPFTGKIENWNNIALDDTAKAAAVVKPILDAA